MIPKEFQDFVNIHLQEFFQKKKQSVRAWDLRLEELISQIESVTLRGGDRLRPYMCALGYQIYGPRTLEQIIPLLLALELFHSFALIHDDIIDAAFERRGGPTISAHFTQNLRNEHLAGSLSLLAGDLCLVWVHEMLLQLREEFPANEIGGIMSVMEEDVILGQALDMWGMAECSEEALIRMYEAKSGNYSIQKPLLIGAKLAGVKDEDYKILTTFGHQLGLAFQLQDDLLGMFGDSEKLGKSTNSDIYEGKWTFLMAFAWGVLQPGERLRLKKILGNRDATTVDCDWVREILVATSAKMKVLAWMEELVENAKQQIFRSNFTNQKELTNLVNFIIKRTY